MIHITDKDYPPICDKPDTEFIPFTGRIRKSTVVGPPRPFDNSPNVTPKYEKIFDPYQPVIWKGDKSKPESWGVVG